jgi:putative AlgH/UPF0301 family transcriptional regulator
VTKPDINTHTHDARPPRFSKRLQGYILILLAVSLLWAAQHYDRTAQQGHHRLLVSTAKTRGDVFEKSVVLVLHHLKSGALGIVINKGDEGGPVGHDKVFTVHTLDKRVNETAPLADIGLGLVEGAAAAEKLAAQKPAWHLTVKGYAGWSGRQLDYEINEGEWRVLHFDPALAQMSGEAMWIAADKKAGAADK